MKVISVLGSKSHVLTGIQRFIADNKASGISVNNQTGEIIARLKRSFFMSDELKFRIKQIQDNIISVELAVNQARSNDDDQKKEISILGKICNYL